MMLLNRSVRPLALAAALLWLGGGIATAQAEELKDCGFSFKGVFGTYDRASLQRGLQIYKEVCSNCHALKELYYRNIGALGYNEDQVKAFASQYQVTNETPNDQGKMFERPARPSDHFVAPFPNDEAARVANGGALPPDLALITKSREGGADYVCSLLQGFKEAPAGVKVPTGLYYNEYFPGHNIAMPPPLQDGTVTFADGTPNNLAQEAKDISTFLEWAAEPELEARHRLGVKVIMFLVVLAGVLYAAKRRIWSDVH